MSKVPAPVALVLGAAVAISSGCGSSGEGDKPVDQIVTDVKAAVSAVHSYRISGVATAKDGDIRFDFQIGGTARLKGSLTLKNATANLIIVDGTAYIQGREFFRQTAGDAAATLVGDKFVKIPQSAAGNLDTFKKFTDTSLLARCLFDRHGTLSKGSSTSVDGTAVIEVKDAGDKPGTQPGVLDVATSGPAYPVHLKSTGPTTSGGTPSPECDGSSGTPSDPSSRLDASLRDFGASVDIQPPKDALDLSTLGGQSG